MREIEPRFLVKKWLRFYRGGRVLLDMEIEAALVRAGLEERDSRG